MNNLFRCSCGARVVCGRGDPQYDGGLNELRSDHAKMGHQPLKPLKIPSNPLEERKMTIYDDEDAETPEDDDSYAYKDDELVA